ncbi:ShlB/FhaC/HecB family hemolysin secretion/activation protein [Noviherbaspirillum sp.]|uniref:ShlB/FhaC/HecB family hemolysin secretion/activation protein n=1 Tax=Noviherbaspirillum sp. TaxID=1926288 RepID=UPI002D75729B|nr:ShlB/FhaC/HecB family hemolysin secretion/activation protein [Noviherbaspirillum sp.]HZW21081.1 ShlB/FhaC/HecB family hemolysin secretion/activation protein [Noviherbaspirillum sp.]
MNVHERAILFALCLAGLAPHAHGQSLSDPELQRRLAHQREQAQASVKPAVDVLTGATDEQTGSFALTQEVPCFRIQEIVWEGARGWDWLVTDSATMQGRCIGARGLRALQDHLTRRLIARGYITSRVLVPEQNLAAGRLALQLVAGNIGKIRAEGASVGFATLVLPAGPGDVLNQRDLDQALENIRRLYSQYPVEFDLLPGEVQGETDIVVKYPEGKRWRGVLTLDDSGTKATGRAQLGGILLIDSPLYLHDALTLTLNRNANAGNGSRGTRSSSLHWSVPFGYWSILLGVSQTQYKQTVAGFSGDIVYAGRSHGAEVGIGWVPYRTATARGALQVKFDRKVSRTFIDDTAIDVQYRNIVGYDVGFTHRQSVDNGRLDLGIGFKGSMPGHSAAPGQIIGTPDWDGRFRLQTFTVNLTLPFQANRQQFRYQANLRAQRATTPVPNAEFFSIGNRYTVRGFDGESTLAAEEGAVLRNDLAWLFGAHEVFVALDTGRVGGPHAASLAGKSMTGIACGLRGRIDRFNYELTIGRPLSKPDGFDARSSTMTAALGAEF